uniref:Uncharacterized protein n=1 Tax=Pyrodinium bahamense TaxID=73915 RepID=A0A7S0AGE7_9DINO|mmetsp:Transcript_34219/g.94533  ORF Transcript_34219/g.94533 Transcript_34219/m.94533 type:complete len:154 (+) Transcript_34219:65-526(+)
MTVKTFHSFSDQWEVRSTGTESTDVASSLAPSECTAAGTEIGWAASAVSEVDRTSFSANLGNDYWAEWSGYNCHLTEDDAFAPMLGSWRFVGLSFEEELDEELGALPQAPTTRFEELLLQLKRDLDRPMLDTKLGQAPVCAPMQPHEKQILSL